MNKKKVLITTLGICLVFSLFFTIGFFATSFLQTGSSKEINVPFYKAQNDDGYETVIEGTRIEGNNFIISYRINSDQYQELPVSVNGKCNYYEIVKTNEPLDIVCPKEAQDYLEMKVGHASEIIKLGNEVKYDFLKYVGSNVDLIQAYSEYQICNPTDIDFFTLQKSKDYFNWYFDEVDGKLTDTWFEIRVNVSRMETLNDWSRSCDPYQVQHKNGTIEIIDNCTDTNKPYQVQMWNWAWQPYNPIGKNFKSNECFNIRIYGKYEPAFKNNRIAIDNVIEVAGYNFDEYAWWNVSWSYKRASSFNNTQDRGQAFPFLINVTDTTNFQSNVSDYRAIDSGESTELIYFLDSKPTATSALFWAEPHATIGPSANYSFYSYYGNPTAINTSRTITDGFGNITLWYTSKNNATHLEDITGASSGISYTPATASGTPIYFQNSSCRSGECYAYESTDASVVGKFTTDAAIPIPENFSVSVWIWRATGSVYDNVWGFETDTGPHPILGDPADDDGLACDRSANARWTGGSMTMQSWYFVTCTYDNVNTCIYVHNETYRFSACSANPIDSGESIQLTIGGWSTGNSYGWSGFIDELRLWNKTLSATEEEQVFRSYDPGQFRFGAEEVPPTPAINNNYTSTNLWLNETEANLNPIYTASVNVTAILNASGTINFDLNQTLYGSATEVGTWYLNVSDLANATYNVTAYFNHNGTHNNSAQTYYIYVRKGDTNIDILFNNTPNVNLSRTFSPDISINITCWVNITQPDDNLIVFWRNSTLIGVQAGQITYLETLPAVGFYNYTCNRVEYGNYTTFVRESFLTITPAGQSISLTVPDNHTYGTADTVICTGNVTSNLYMNDVYTPDFNNTATVFGAGENDWVCNTTANNNYTFATASHAQNINKQGVSVTHWLNGTEGDYSGAYPTSANITASLNRSDTINIDRNGTNIGFATDSLIRYENDSSLAAEDYNITAYFNGNQNYTSHSVTRYIKIAQGSINITLMINGTGTNTTLAFSEDANITSSINLTSLSYTLYRNGSSIDSGTGQLENNERYGAADYNFTSAYEASSNYSMNSDTIYLTVNPTGSGISLTASPGWSIAVNTESTITCSASSTTTLYKDSVIVTSPYTSTQAFGTYNFTCEVMDKQNYTSLSTMNWLNVLSGGFGCTDAATFAFMANITSVNDTTSVNLTSLVSNNYILPFFQDVYTNTSGVTLYRNQSGSEYHLFANTSTVTSFMLYFGNYISNNTIANTSSDITKNTSTLSYEEINPYYIVNLLDEKQGTYLLPPGANITATLYCTQGVTDFSVNQTKFLVATYTQLNESKMTVAYSADDLYYRNLQTRSSIENKKFYVVDANDHQVVQYILKLQDNTGDFAGSLLKVKKYLEASLETITELDFDAENKAVVYLINGDRYQLYVDNGEEERNIGNLYVDSTDLEKTIVIGDITTTDISGANVTMSLNLTGGKIVFSWVDIGANTNEIEFWVWNYTNQSEQLYYASSTNRSRIDFNYLVSDANASYLVKYQVKHGIFGNQTTGAQMVFVGSSILPAVFPLLTLITLLGGSGSVWLTLLFIFPIPMFFTGKYAGLAAVTMVGIVSLLVYWQMYALAGGLAALGLFIAVLIELQNRKRRGP